MDDALLAYGWLGLALLVWIGLCVGSFLNVVVYRLPVMLNRQWHAEANEFLRNRTALRARQSTGLSLSGNRYRGVDSLGVLRPRPEDSPSDLVTSSCP